MINIDNFTVTVVSFPEFVGVDWSLDNPTAILRLTPNQGFEIDAINFQVDPLTYPLFVANVVFTQDGSDVLCTITYNQPSIMPAQDVFINLCASGFSRPTNSITVNGNISYGTSGVVNNNNPLSYSGQGSFGETNIVANFVLSAIAGNYFEYEPDVALTVGNTANYNISSVSTADSNGNIIQYNYTVEYTYPQNNVVFDQIQVKGGTIPINNPIVSVNAYQIDLSSIPPAGEGRSLFLYGVEGAAYQIDVTNSVGLILPWSPIVGVIPASGSIELTDVVFPAVTADDSYTFVISGDLNPNFAQPTTWVIYQYVNTTLTYELTSSNANLVIGPPIVQAGQPGTYFPGQGSAVPITIEVTYTQPITFTGVPVLDDDWTNQYQQTPLTITDYDQYVGSTQLINDPGNNKVTIDAIGYISYAGAPSLVSQLDLDAYIQGNYQPISLAYSSSSDSDACCQGVIGTYFIQIGETFANAVAILDSSGNPAADGYYSQ